jgi:hypothetical protein
MNSTRLSWSALHCSVQLLPVLLPSGRSRVGDAMRAGLGQGRTKFRVFARSDSAGRNNIPTRHRFLLRGLALAAAMILSPLTLAASSWLTSSTTSYVYEGGPFGSPEAAVQDIAVQYGISRGGLEEDYLGCPSNLNLVKTGFDNQSIGLSLRERSSPTANWSDCFFTSWYVTEKACPVEQQSRPTTGGSACKDKAPLACQNATYSDGVNCTATCSVDPYRVLPFKKMGRKTSNG